MIDLILVLGGLFAIVLVSRRFQDYERRIAALEAHARGAGPIAVQLAPAPPAAPVMPPAEPAPAPELPRSALGPQPPMPVSPLPAPASGPGIEEALGTRWAVWVGGVALAIGGVLLVRYSIEQDLVGPRLRVALGLLFAAALTAGGEWLRRREAPLRLSAFPAANIPAILTAAGTATAFASVYAAYGLYGLVGPAAAFVALGLVSLVAIGAALLHGPALAGFGLVAALASPLLVETNDPSPVALVLYLAFAIGSAYGVARLRLWRWLAICGAVGAWLWGGLLLVMGDAWLGGAVAHVVVQLALALLFLVVDAHRGERDEDPTTDRLAAIVLGGFALLAIGAAVDLGAGPMRSLFVGLVVAMLAGTSFRFAAAAPGLGAAALAAVGGLALWPVARQAAGEQGALIRDLPSAPLPDALSLFLTSALILAAILLATGMARLALGRALRFGPAAWYAGAATLGTLAILIVAYWRVTAFDASVPFALVAGVLGLAFALAAGWVRRIDPTGDSPALRLALGATASAAVAALAAGLTFAFDRGILTVTLALAALGTSIVSDRSRVPALRYVVGALGLAVAGRLAWDPSVMRGAIGATPIVNWLLWGYGVPALAFGLAAHVLARGGRDGVVRFVESLSFLFAALLVFLEIRHALHAGDPFATRSNHLEAGLVVTEALGFTLLTLRLDLRAPDTLYRVASMIFGAWALLGAGAMLLVRTNPYLSGEPVLGGALLNSLLPAYLIPAAMAGAVAVVARRNRPRAFVLAACVLALLLELAYAFLELRVAFQGARIGFVRPTGQAELWGYSLILLLNGLVLLAIGIWRDWRDARIASLACIVAAVLKVFLVDLSTLDGLTRALSVVGLGLVLVAIGFVYQRLLAGRVAARS